MTKKEVLSITIGATIVANCLLTQFYGYNHANAEKIILYQDNGTKITVDREALEQLGTDLAIQGLTSLIGGYPIGDNIKANVTTSGDPKGYAYCTSSNKKVESFSSTTYQCTCVAFGGWCIPQTPQSKSVSFTSGGVKSEKMKFRTMRCDDKACHFGSVTATLTASVYDGSNELDGANMYGDFYAGDGGGGFSSNNGGNSGIWFDDGSLTISESDGATFRNSNGENVSFTNNSGESNGENNLNEYLKDGENIANQNGENSWSDAVNELLNDSGGFNAGDDDWSSANGGKDGSSDLDDYLNGAWDGADDVNGATTDDMLGLNDSSANGSDFPFENMRSAALLDTNGDTVPDAIDLDGDGKADGVLIDTNGDGKMDAVDFNGDGKADAWMVDEDGDGVMDGIDYDGDGKIDQYFNGHEPREDDVNEENQSLNGTSESIEYTDATEAQLMDILRQQLASSPSQRMGMGASNDSSALGNNPIFNGLFGNDEQDMKKNTISNQEMFELGKTILAKMGISEKDILSGKQYAKDSAWTEPDKAWDFNRMTTLLKKKKVKTMSSMQKDEKKPATMGGAMK